MPIETRGLLDGERSRRVADRAMTTLPACRRRLAEESPGRDGQAACSVIRVVLHPTGPVVRLGAFAASGWELSPASRTIRLDNALVPRGDAVAAHLLPAGDVTSGAGHIPHRAGDLLIADPADPLAIEGPPGHGMTLSGPRSLFAMILPAAQTPLVAPRSGVSNALGHFLDDLLAGAAEQLTDEQAGFAGTAALHLVGAALAISATPNVAARRTATLLARASNFIDRHIGEAIDAHSLSAALGYSRATLYRAVAPAGGVAELVARRRLAAAHGSLSDPREVRSVGEIARAQGFCDAAQFSRRFKHHFGVTPGAVRRAAQAGPADAQ